MARRFFFPPFAVLSESFCTSVLEKQSGMKKTIPFIFWCVLLTLVGCSADQSTDETPLREQANALYNEQQFKEALALYEQALAKADGGDRLTLRQDIIDCHLAMGEATEARRLLGDLMKEAHESGDKYAEAEATFAMGEQLHEVGDKEKGYRYMLQAIPLMSQCEGDEATNCLAYYHYVLMKRYGGDEHYPQAIEHSKVLEQTVAPMDDAPQALKFRRIALAVRAYLYMRVDSVAEAERAYAEWQRLLPCLNITEERDICPYYMECGKGQEALDVYRRYEAYVLEVKGYWSNMERLICKNVADIYANMGQADSAYNRLLQAYEIKDTLQARMAEENAQELEAVYQNQVKTEQISRLRLWVGVLTAVLGLVAIVVLAYRIHAVRKREDKRLARTVKNLVTGQMAKQEDMDAEKARFVAFDAIVEQGLLYTQSDLSREVLAGLMGVDRTTFSRIIREQSGCQNMNDYLNQKRLRHAEQLMREQPRYTIQAIMQDSGFAAKSTFTTLFKKAYGMTPSEYRNRL